MLQQILKNEPKTDYYNIFETDHCAFGCAVKNAILKYRKENQPLIIICIGSDRVTGDCLGPLVGHKLKESYFPQSKVYGSLSHPVHAKNLISVIHDVNTNYKNPFIVVIDAALGKKEHIGYVTLSSSPLKPGKGVKKQLPSVGHLSITGIVNISTADSSELLQNTRLHLVMELADFIYSGLLHGLSRLS